MKIKKTVILLAALVLLTSVFGIGVFAADDIGSVDVYVTFANGTLNLSREKISVTDTDGDGILSLNDAFYLAHQAKYKGGAKDGYRTEVGQYGLYITMLWGDENGSGFGYYLNNSPASGLTDEVKSGDSVCAFVYTDTQTFSDTYCFFNESNVTTKLGEEFTLTLSSVGYDNNWNPVTNPVSDATILIDGKETSYKTDVNGKVTLKTNSAKTAIISAKSDSVILVPPVCKADVLPIYNWIIILIVAFLTVIASVVFIIIVRKKSM